MRQHMVHACMFDINAKHATRCYNATGNYCVTPTRHVYEPWAKCTYDYPQWSGMHNHQCFASTKRDVCSITTSTYSHKDTACEKHVLGIHPTPDTHATACQHRMHACASSRLPEIWLFLLNGPRLSVPIMCCPWPVLGEGPQQLTPQNGWAISQLCVPLHQTFCTKRNNVPVY